MDQLSIIISQPHPTKDQVTRVADAVKDVDRKRLEDFEKIRTELQKLSHGNQQRVQLAAALDRERDALQRGHLDAAGAVGLDEALDPDDRTFARAARRPCG